MGYNMTMGKGLKWEHEWYLYSAVAITSSLTFLVLQFSNGMPQTIGIAFSAIVATFLFASNSWKTLPKEIHQWSIFFSVVVTFLAGFVLYIINNKKVVK